MSKLEMTIKKLESADAVSRSIFNKLTVLMQDKDIPLRERYAVMDRKEIDGHFKLIELEAIFDKDEVRQIETWET